MDREAREYLKWLGIVALAVVLINMLACTRVVYKEPPPPYVLVPEVTFQPCDSVSLCTIAEVKCSEDNRPVILVRQGLAIGDGALFVKAHEDKHLEQMRADCKKVQKDYMDSLSVRKRMESEAYCAEARERLRVQRDVAVVSNWYNSIMYAIFETYEFTCSLKPP